MGGRAMYSMGSSLVTLDLKIWDRRMYRKLNQLLRRLFNSWQR